MGPDALLQCRQYGDGRVILSLVVFSVSCLLDEINANESRYSCFGMQAITMDITCKSETACLITGCVAWPFKWLLDGTSGWQFSMAHKQDRTGQDLCWWQICPAKIRHGPGSASSPPTDVCPSIAESSHGLWRGRLGQQRPLGTGRAVPPLYTSKAWFGESHPPRQLLLQPTTLFASSLDCKKSKRDAQPAMSFWNVIKNSFLVHCLFCFWLAAHGLPVEAGQRLRMVHVASVCLLSWGHACGE